MTPKIHRFRYAVTMLLVDLAELPGLLAPRGLLSAARFAPLSFRREDHLGPAEQSLDNSVRDVVGEQTGRRPVGPIRLLTHFRCFGYYFSPLNLYYCFDERGEAVETIVAQVSNTPWLETHNYVLCDENRLAGPLSFQHAKEFHVSPFMDLNYDYRWRLSPPNERLRVQIRNLRDGRRSFDAALLLKRRELTQANLRRAMLRHPFMTGQVTAAIYYQALRLWIKRCPYFPHPKTESTAANRLPVSRPTSTPGQASLPQTPIPG